MEVQASEETRHLTDDSEFHQRYNTSQEYQSRDQVKVQFSYELYDNRSSYVSEILKLRKVLLDTNNTFMLVPVKKSRLVFSNLSEIKLDRFLSRVST